MDIIQKTRGLFLFEGVLLFLLGLFAIAMPTLSSLSVELLVGALFVAGGIVQGIKTFELKRALEIIWSIVLSLLYLAAGGILLTHPWSGMLTLTLFLAIFFLIEGIAKIYFSFRLKNYENWGWLLVSGILSVIISAIIWSGFPGTASWVIGLLVGINLLFLGLSMIFLSRNIDETKPPQIGDE